MRGANRFRGLLLLVAAVAAGTLALALLPFPQARTQSTTFEERQVLQFALLFGVGDASPAAWDGSIQATGARIQRIEASRPAPGDVIEQSSWKLGTRRVSLTRGVQDSEAPVLPAGVYVTAEVFDPEAKFAVATTQGKFVFAAREIEFGRSPSFLKGRVRVERGPLTRQLTTSIEEQDFPALAERDDNAYLAYVEFRHGNRSQGLPWPLTEQPHSYEPLRRPVGGDQVFFREYSKAARTWGEPEAVTLRGLDIFGVAIAVDGGGRVWVFWSTQAREGFDLFARCRDGGHWSEEIRLTHNLGPDLSPVAATDSNGAVWVAWQGFRNGDFDVLVARQEDTEFSEEHQVSISDANDWAPQIATGPEGLVAVVWDSYDKGDYDVHARAMRYDHGVGMEIPLPVAASQKSEARASAAYDARGRLWVAYEESFAARGKDFGAYELSGSGLRQGNTVRLKIFDGRRPFVTVKSFDEALRRTPAIHPLNKKPQRAGQHDVPLRELPDPSVAANRQPGTESYAPERASKSRPRLTALRDGSIVLAYRNPAGNIEGPLGTAWFGNVLRYDGEDWAGPVFLPRSDGLLDQRSAMVPVSNGRMLIVGTTDHRFTKGSASSDERDEVFNSDLMAYEFDFRAVNAAIELTAGAPEEPVKPMSSVGAELSQVSMMRNYRAKIGMGRNTEELRLMRGEFHRHTAISADGASDGDLSDAFRYMLDAAYVDWGACCDDANGGREYPWWLTQKMTDAFSIEGRFLTMFSHGRGMEFPDGHRNLLFARRGIRPLPLLPNTGANTTAEHSPDTQMLYEYLRYFGGIAAVTSPATNMGTDWRDNDPEVEPVVEIYQGDRQSYEMPGAPRAISAADAIGGWHPLGFVSAALQKGYRLAFAASSGYVSTHMAYCNLWVAEATRPGLLEAFKKRRVYAATDNILADVRCAGHFMGEEFSLHEPPSLDVKLIGTADFAAVHIIKDGTTVYSARPGKRDVAFSWKDPAAERGKTSHYYVRGEQVDGELVWVSPMWIRVD